MDEQIFNQDLGRYVTKTEHEQKQKEYSRKALEERDAKKKALEVDEPGVIAPLKVLVLEYLLKNCITGLENRIVVCRNILNLNIDESNKRMMRGVKQARSLFIDIYPILLIKVGDDKELLLDLIGEEGIAMAEEAGKSAELVKRNNNIARSGSIVVPEKVHLTDEELRAASASNEGPFYPPRALVKGVVWPHGVESGKREKYLNDDDFMTIFGMRKSAFEELPKFKRINLKKDKNFF